LLRWVRPKYRQLQAAAALKRCQNGVSNYLFSVRGGTLVMLETLIGML